MTEKIEREVAGAVVARVAKKTALLALVSAVVSLFFFMPEGAEAWRSFLAGILAGAGLGVLNFRWLALIVEKVYTKQVGVSPARRIMSWPLNILKLSAIFIILYVLIRHRSVHLTGLVTGLSISFISILWEGLTALSRDRRGIKKEEA